MRVVVIAGAGSGVFLSAAADRDSTMQTVSFGSLSPKASGTPSVVSLPVRLVLPASNAPRFRVTAVTSFVFEPSTRSRSGKTLSAADIGVGIGQIAAGRPLPNGWISITPGFDNDPSRMTRVVGAAATATLADLLTGRDILQGQRATNDLTFTITLGVLPQFATPGSFSGTITLTTSDSR